MSCGTIRPGEEEGDHGPEGAPRRSRTPENDHLGIYQKRTMFKEDACKKKTHVELLRFLPPMGSGRGLGGGNLNLLSM